MLEIKNLFKTIGDLTLKADLRLHASERLGIQGPSGVGKTTLLRIVAGLVTLKKDGSEGRIGIDGRDVTSFPPEKRRVGFVFQDAALFSAYSALQNLALPLTWKGVPQSQAQAKAQDALSRAGLSGLASRSVDQLSAGERQRVAVLRTLLTEPSVLLFDEIFANVDPRTRDAFRDFLKTELDRLRVPVLMVSHDATDFEGIATAFAEIRAHSDQQSIRELNRLDRQLTP